MIKALINVRIYDYKDYIENGYIIFEEKILKVGPMEEFVPGKFETINGHGFLIVPNLVACHTHIYFVLARGLSLPKLPINEAVYILNKMSSKINKDDAYYCGICAGSELLRNGVTTVIDHHISGANVIGTLEKLEEAMVTHLGMRAILSYATSDRFNVDRGIKENLNFIEHAQSAYSRGLFGIESSQAIGEEGLEKIAKSIGDNPIHMIVAETESDEEDCKNKYNKTIIERLNDHNLLKPYSLLSNGNYLSGDELEMLRGKNIYMAVTPTSTINFNNHVDDIMRFKRHGLKAVIGNNGLTNTITNEYLNIYFTSKLSKQAMEAQDLLDIINNGYEYASKILGVKLGKIAPGYEADFSSLLYTPFSKMDANNAFEHLFLGIYPRYSPNSVFVGGKCLIKNGKPLESKMERELEKAKDRTMSLWKRIVEE